MIFFLFLTSFVKHVVHVEWIHRKGRKYHQGYFKAHAVAYFHVSVP